MLRIVLGRVGSIMDFVMGFLNSLRFSVIEVLSKGVRVLIVFRFGLLFLYVFRETFLIGQTSGLLRGDSQSLSAGVC